MKGFCDVISFDFVHGGKVALRQLQVDDFAACPKYFNLITMPCFVSAPLINWTQMWTKRGKHEKVACLPCVFHPRTADSIHLQNFGSLVPNDQNLLILLYQIISICWRLFVFKNPIELEKNFNIHYTFNVFFPSHIREIRQMICRKSLVLETSDTKGHFDETQTLVFVCFPLGV